VTWRISPALDSDTVAGGPSAGKLLIIPLCYRILNMCVSLFSEIIREPAAEFLGCFDKTPHLHMMFKFFTRGNDLDNFRRWRGLPSSPFLQPCSRFIPKRRESVLKCRSYFLGESVDEPFSESGRTISRSTSGGRSVNNSFPFLAKSASLIHPFHC